MNAQYGGFYLADRAQYLVKLLDVIAIQLMVGKFNKKQSAVFEKKIDAIQKNALLLQAELKRYYDGLAEDCFNAANADKKGLRE